MPILNFMELCKKIKEFFLLDIKIALPLTFKYFVRSIFPKNQLTLIIYIFILSILSFMISNQLIVNSDIKDSLSFYHITTARILNKFIAKNDNLSIFYALKVFPVDLTRQSIEYFYQLINKPYTRSDIDNFPVEKYLDVLQENNFNQIIDNVNNELTTTLNLLDGLNRRGNFLQNILNWLQIFNIIYAFELGLLSMGILKEEK